MMVMGSHEILGAEGATSLEAGSRRMRPPVCQGPSHPPTSHPLPDVPIVKMGRLRPVGEEKTWLSCTGSCELLAV